MNRVIRPVQRRERDGSGRVQIQVQLAPKISVPGLVLAGAVKIGAVAAVIERRIFCVVPSTAVAQVATGRCHGHWAGCSRSGGLWPRPPAAQGLQRRKLERIVCKRYSLLPEVTPLDVTFARIDMCTNLAEAPFPGAGLLPYIEVVVRAPTVTRDLSTLSPGKNRQSPKGTPVLRGTAVLV